MTADHDDQPTTEAAPSQNADAEASEESQETRSPQEIRADIDSTRDELGETVEQLAAKTDVKGQARQRVDDAKETARQKREEFTAKAKDTTPASAQEGGRQIVDKVRENPAPAAIGAAILAGFLIGRLTSR